MARLSKGKRAGACEKMGISDEHLPDWAKELLPVPGLRTNNGARIRNCVTAALRKTMRPWARDKLVYSISKEVYRANACGQTKNIVKDVLEELRRKMGLMRSPEEMKKKLDFSLPDITLKLCRMVLRNTASLVFREGHHKLFKRTMTEPPIDDAHSVTNSPAAAFNNLDFRTIDCKLSVNAYGTSHEAFLRDVEELWKNLRIEHAKQPELIQLVDTLSKHFESLYRKEVLDHVKEMREYLESDSVSVEADCEVQNILALARKMPDAVWNSGLCKVCNENKDDDSVILCDICDGEYHIYCLQPPLGAVPEGKWYCPSCISPANVAKATSNVCELPVARNVKDHIGSHQSEKLGCLKGDGMVKTSEDEAFICEVCSNKGSRDAVVNCNICKVAFVHRNCLDDKSKISGKDVLWACRGCKPMNTCEQSAEKAPLTCDQAFEQGGTGKRKECHFDKENDGKKDESTVNSSDADTHAGRTEQGQSPKIEEKKGEEKVKKIRT